MATVQRSSQVFQSSADARVYHPLDRLRGIVRRYVVYEGLLSVCIFLALWYALALVLDYGVFKAFTWDWVQDGGKWIRVTALVVGVLLLIGIVFFRIAWRLTKELSYPALALVLERRFPKVLGDRLITAVELADIEKAARHGYSAAMVRTTIEQARERVGTVPVSEVFNWRRLWIMAGIALGILFLTVVVAFAIHAISTKNFRPVHAGWKLYHVSTIAAERDLLLWDTPWPRRAMVELVEVSDKGLRVPQNRPVTTIRAKAYRWVIADRYTQDGWRPLKWSDITEELVGVSVPDVPFQLMNLPTDAPPRRPFSAAWSVDDVIERGRNNLTVRTRLSEAMGVDKYQQLQAVFDRLEVMADDPSLGRTIRRLDDPETVEFEYLGATTAGSGPLTSKGEGIYEGTIGGMEEDTKLREDVRFLVKAEDFRTADRPIVLVPAPILQRLTRIEKQPAYLHYASPEAPDPKQPDRKIILGYAELKGLRQTMPEERISLIGDNSTFAVPDGTEVVIKAVTEEPIVRAEVIPEVGPIPGARPDSQDPIPLKITNGNSFQLAFEGPNRIQRVNEQDRIREKENAKVRTEYKFKFRMVNADGITSERPVQITIIQDAGPVVEVTPEWLRRISGVYYITPRARIPFTSDSYLRDENGISKVALNIEYQSDDSQIILLQRTGNLARDVVVPLCSGNLAHLGQEGAQYAQFVLKEKSSEASYPFPAFFAADDALKRYTLDHIRSLLDKPLAGEKPKLVDRINLKSEVVRREEYSKSFPVKVRQPDGTEREQEFKYLKSVTRRLEGDHFDVSQLGLEVPPGDPQPTYDLTLDVRVTDTNFDTGPGIAGNSEKIKFKVVPASALLVKIGEEQIGLGAKLDEALDKLGKAKNKYEFVNSRNGYLPLDQIDAVKVRSKDASQDVVKARELIEVVSREFRRIERECVINQLDESNISGNAEIANRLVRLLAEIPQPASPEESKRVVDEDIDILQGRRDARPTFNRTEELMNAAQSNLDQGRWADPATVTNALIELNRVEAELMKIRQAIGGSLTKDHLREMARTIRDKQESIGKMVKEAQIKFNEIATLPTPAIVPIGQVFLAKGETRPFKHAIQWRQYKEDDLLVKIEASDKAALTVPAEIKLDFEKNSQNFEYVVKAGNKEGEYTITLTPASGDKVEVKVVVK